MSPKQSPLHASNEEERQETSSLSMEKDDPLPSDKAWPETVKASGCCPRLRGLYSSWSFSYMNPILRKGKDQFKEGDHLEIGDLYKVPDDMRSEVLVARFW